MINYSTYEDGTGGELVIKNNGIVTTEALYTAIYLRLFGGNPGAKTTREKPNNEFNETWWGNDSQGDSSQWINSETENVLRGMTINTTNIVKLESAINTDLEDIKQFGEIGIEITYPSLNSIEILITITNTQGKDEVLLVWDATRNEVIESKII